MTIRAENEPLPNSAYLSFPLENTLNKFSPRTVAEALNDFNNTVRPL